MFTRDTFVFLRTLSDMVVENILCIVLYNSCDESQKLYFYLCKWID